MLPAGDSSLVIPEGAWCVKGVGDRGGGRLRVLADVPK